MNLIPPRPEMPKKTVPGLYNGDRLTQAEFHRRYETCPDHVKAELIGGIVYMASPLGHPHGAHHLKLATLFGNFEGATPGVEGLDNSTTVLGETSEPQPDLQLRILAEYGGRTHLAIVGETPYVHGAPELMAEIAHSTAAIDLHRKRQDYQQAGVLEYLVVCLEEQQLFWFHFPDQTSLKPNPQGVWKSRVFPGLWVDGPALLALTMPKLLETGNKGLASRPHAAFVKRLAAAHKQRPA